MDTEDGQLPTESTSARAGVDDSALVRLRWLLPGFIILLLAALVLVPVLIGRRIEALQDHRIDHVYPAQQALQESRSRLTEQLAAVRGYQISGDPTYLTRFQDALIGERPATERLDSLVAALGPRTQAITRQFRTRMAEWQESPRALAAGSITREQLAQELAVEQVRFEVALAAADSVRRELSRHETAVDASIRSVSRLERGLRIVLFLGALAVAVVMTALTRRLQRVTRELEARAQALHDSEARFRLIAENLREMIWISDPAYSIQYYLSPAYERIWGRPVDEARRNPRSFLEAVLPEDRPAVEAALDHYAEGRYAAEYRIMRPDGDVRWISGRAYPVRDEHGTVFRIVGIAEDITVQKQVEQEREALLETERRAHAETESALRVRDRVVSIVSHDLKNPLHTIGMAADLLEMPLAEEQRTRQLEIIRRTVARANRMVGDLLDAARLQSGRSVTVTLEPLPLRELLDELMEAFLLQAEQKDQQLTAEAVGDIGTVCADRDRLLQALSNLLGNAIKFTQEGGRIHLKVERAADGSVLFHVSDTGRGIAADMLPRLFEPFAQARDTASLGTGLGLAITRGIVEAHGGTVSVRSEPGSGTTFTVALPARDDSAPTPFKHPRGDQRAGDRTGTYNDPVDDTLDDSYPASDPPPWWAR